MTPTPRDLTLFFLSWIIAITAVIGMSACSGAQRRDTLHAAVVTVNAAKTAFVIYDKQHQLDIVAKATTKEEGQKALADYRSTQTDIVEAFSTAWSLLALAGSQTDDDSKKRALAEVATLLQKLTTIGVPLTGAKP